MAIEWMSQQWEIPSRSDCYSMQIAAEIRRGLVKNPRSVRVDQLRLRFKRPETDATLSLSDEEIKANRESISKSKWLALAGPNIVHRYVDIYGNPVDPPVQDHPLPGEK